MIASRIRVSSSSSSSSSIRLTGARLGRSWCVCLVGSRVGDRSDRAEIDVAAPRQARRAEMEIEVKVMEVNNLKTNRTNRKSHQERKWEWPSCGGQFEVRECGGSDSAVPVCRSQAIEAEDAEDVDEDQVGLVETIGSVR